MRRMQRHTVFDLQRLRRLLLKSITPVEQQASALGLLQAQGFFAVCWLMLASGLLVGLLLLIDGHSELLGAMLVLGGVMIYAHQGNFRVGKYAVVLVGAALAIVQGLLTTSAEIQQLAIVMLSNMIVLAGIVMPPLALGAFMVACVVALMLVMPAWMIAPVSQGLVFSLVGTATAVGVVRLIWGPLKQAYFNAQHADLQHTMSVVRAHTVGFLYRVAVTPQGEYQLDIVFGSPETTIGQTPQQVIAAGGWQAFLHPNDRPLLNLHWQQALKEGEHVVEYRLRGEHANDWWWVRDHVHAQHTPEATYLHGVLREITGEKRAEANLRTYVLQQAVIAELGMRAIQFETVAQLAEHAARCVEQVIEISGCEVYQHLVETDQLALLGAAGAYTRPERRISLNDRSLPLRDALAQDYLLLNDIPNAPPYNEHAFFVRHSIQHAVIVTIPSTPQPFGLLAIYSQSSVPFSINEVYFLQSLANILGTFVETQRGREQQRRHTEMTLALREAVALIVTEADLTSVLQRILSALQTLIPHHDASTLMLRDEADGALYVAAHRGFEHLEEYITTLRFQPDQSAKYMTLLSNRFVIIPDTTAEPSWKHYEATAWIRSYLGAPIMIDGEFVGLINLDSQRINTFTEADGIVLSVFAEKASLAIRNARRTADLEREVQERTRDLQSEQQRLQTILEATGDGIIYVEQGIMRYVNRALSLLTDFSHMELIDQPIGRFITGLIPYPERGRIERCEGALLCKNGETLAVELTLSALQAGDQRAVIVVRDISARRTLELQQRRFIVNAAHELRTPVTNFNTRLYLLERNPEKLVEHLPVLKRISARMNRLVNDLLDSGSIEQGRLVVEKQPVVLQEILTETFELLKADAEKKNIHTTLSLPPEPLTLHADGHRLQQVFTNLIANAIYYTPEGGHVSVCQRLEADYVIVDVIDTGIGIAPEHQQAIFEPFYRVQAQQAGTGLGLAIAHEIIKLHNGRIRLESEPNRGSTFSVVLPLNEHVPSA